jgi:uncharacterized protein involved in response to NO
MLAGSFAALLVVPVASATHALTMGAIGCTTLGMMARVSLGHSGRPLVVRPSVTIAFGLVTLAAVIRVLGPLSISTCSIALYISGALWSLGFATFTAVYTRILLQPRIDGRPG